MTEERNVQAEDGTTWACVQAYANLGKDAAKVEGTDKYTIVCTPSGGARIVRLELPADWQTALPDEELLRKIESAQQGQ